MAHVATITIDHTKVPGDLTDYVGLIVPDGSAGYSALYALCLEGGGDIRLFKSDDTTELAREIVTFSVSAETGEIHYKYSGTLSSSVDTDIHVYADGSSSDYAVTATYGRNAVWSGYTSVWHGVDLNTSTALDSTGNGYDANKRAANQPISQTSGLFGNEYEFSGTDYLREQASVYDITNTQFTTQLWFKLDTLPVSGSDAYGLMVINSGLNGGARDKQMQISADGSILLQTFDGTSDVSQTAAGFVSTGNYYMAHGVFNGSNIQLFANATAQTSKATVTSFNHSNAGLQVSDQIGNTTYIHGVTKEMRFRLSALSANWITTEYNNQNSPSTFYSVAAVAGSSAAQAARRGVIMMM